MKIESDRHHFELICSKDSHKYYRCVRFTSAKCGARVLSRDGQVYVINGEHNHAAPDVAGKGVVASKATQGATKMDLKAKIAQRLQTLSGLKDIIGIPE